MIERLRYLQQQRQAAAQAKALGQSLATYVGRDDLTGDRKLETADGGRVMASYLGDSEPPSAPVSFIEGRAIGQPGIMGRK